jgi:flagellar biosynthetic protein FliR
MWDVIFNRYLLFLLVLVRMTGMVVFNPVYGRRNIPANLKVGFAFVLAMIVTSSLPDAALEFDGLPMFALACFKELLVGFLASFVFQLFLSSFQMAGEIIDLQLGVGMSKVYDPQSNVSMPLTGSIYNLIFMLMFFAGNGHLTMIKIIAISFQILPAGPQLINPAAGGFIIELFGNILILAIKIALPIVALEVIVEFGMGILMRTVPQINIFVAGLQIKLLIGIIIIVLLMPSISNLIDMTITTMLNNIVYGLKALA